MGNSALHGELNEIYEKQAPADGAMGGPVLNDLDSAVALLELAGHPHILAREAFTVFQESGCAEAVALVATGRETRILAVHGWSETEALQACHAVANSVRTESPCADLIPTGQHRDETWQILARPKPDLDHRCTVVAIRKLVATARHPRPLPPRREAARRPLARRGARDDGGLWVSEQMTELLTDRPAHRPDDTCRSS